MVPLSVNIASFTGRRVNETTVLSWTTESESNSERFEMERSTYGSVDGSAWQKISQMAAAGSEAVQS
jgi:hypothetical protein